MLGAFTTRPSCSFPEIVTSSIVTPPIFGATFHYTYGRRVTDWFPPTPVMIFASAGTARRIPRERGRPRGRRAGTPDLRISRLGRRALHGRPRRVRRRAVRKAADLRGGRHVSRTA